MKGKQRDERGEGEEDDRSCAFADAAGLLVVTENDERMVVILTTGVLHNHILAVGRVFIVRTFVIVTGAYLLFALVLSLSGSVACCSVVEPEGGNFVHAENVEIRQIQTAKAEIDELGTDVVEERNHVRIQKQNRHDDGQHSPKECPLDRSEA